MNIFKSIIVIGIGFVVFSCSNMKSQRENEFYVEDDVEVLSAKSFIKNINLIQLQSNNDEYLIGKIDKIQKRDNQFYILDNQYNKAIYVFNDKGQPLKKWSKFGQGPNEYLQILDFDLNDTDLVLLCFPAKIIYLDINNLEPKREEYLLKDKFYSRISLYQNSVLLYDHATGTVDCVTSQDEGVENIFEDAVLQGNLFYPQPVFYKTSKDFFYQSSGGNTLYKISDFQFDEYLSFDYKAKINSSKFYESREPVPVTPMEISKYPLPNILSVFEYNNHIGFIYAFGGLFYFSYTESDEKKITNNLFDSHVPLNYHSISIVDNKIISWIYPFNLSFPNMEALDIPITENILENAESDNPILVEIELL